MKLNHEIIFFPSICLFFVLCCLKCLHVPCVCCSSINILVRENEIKNLINDDNRSCCCSLSQCLFSCISFYESHILTTIFLISSWCSEKIDSLKCQKRGNLFHIFIYKKSDAILIKF